MKNWGAWVNAVIGISKQCTPLFGPLITVNAIFHDYQVLMKEIPGTKLKIAVVVISTANIKDVILKIRKLMGLYPG